jgi:hypothetical protein
MSVFERSVELPVSTAEAFAWHAREGAFEHLRSPWLRPLLTPSGPPAQGTPRTRYLAP